MLGVDSYKINRESSWKATASLRKLEVHHKRPVGLRYYKGLLHGLCVSTNAIKEAHIQSGSINVNVERLINKGEVSKIPNPQAGFYSNLLLVQKKDGGIKTSDQSESPKSACADTTLQDGGHPYLEGVNTARRLACKGRFEGYILLNSN